MREQHSRIVIDRPDVIALEQLRIHLLDDLPIREHVRHAARHAQVVLEHQKPAVGATNEIGADDGQIPVVRHADADHLAPKMSALAHELARHDAGVEDPSLVIHVVKKMIERRDALNETALHRRPFGSRDQPRQQIERKDALDTFGLAVDREGDALGDEREVGGALAFAPLLERQPAQTMMDAGVMRTMAVGPSNISSYASPRR